jgi:hypothetical protein
VTTNVEALFERWDSAVELGTGKQSIVMKAIAGELAQAIAADRAQQAPPPPDPDSDEIERMRIGRCEMDALRLQLHDPHRYRLTDWEVVEIAGDELRNIREGAVKALRSLEAAPVGITSSAREFLESIKPKTGVDG